MGLIMLFLIICLIAHTSAAPERPVYSQDDGIKLFEEFIKEHNKQYGREEKEERFKIFLDNLKEINDLNKRSPHTTFGITRFTDLTKEEFSKTFTGYKSEKNSLWKELKKVALPKSFNHTAPDEFDWRSKNVVSRVKDQGNCGSCWAFSTTGNVESINAIKSGNIVEISEQQLVDCDKQAVGCNGGDLNSPFELVYPDSCYFVKNGAMSSDSYPYTATDGPCKYDSKSVVIKLQKYEQENPDEDQMKEILFSTGPLSIGLAANPLQFYKKGILIKDCGDTAINHAVLLVGYGKEKDVPFWLIKNSWSSTWGEEGYFRIKRGVNCLSLTVSGITTAIV